MNHDFAMKWADALESDKYPQSRYALFNGEGYCCLGVACEISGLFTFERVETECDLNGIANPYISYVYDNATIALPTSVIKLTQMKEAVGFYTTGPEKKDRCSLAADNDQGKTFPQIAAIIREHWEEL